MPQPEYIIAPYILRDIEKYFANKLSVVCHNLQNPSDGLVASFAGFMIASDPEVNLLKAMGLRLSYDKAFGFHVSFLR